MNRICTLTGAGVLAVLVAACGPAASASPSSSPTSSAAESSAPSEVVLPSFSQGVVADLEALIPETIGDLSLVRSSMRGDEYLVSDDADEQMGRFLEDVGVDPQDISMAIGYGFSTDYSQTAFVIIFRAAGAEQDRLVSAFKESMDASSDAPTVWTPATAGGKNLETSGTLAEDGQVTYLYASGDTLFFVTLTDPALAEEVFAGLP